MSAHTPGKFTAREIVIGRDMFQYCEVVDEAGDVLARTNPNTPRTISNANAALLASAPDLLAECDALRAANAELAAALRALLALNQPEYETSLARAALAKGAQP